MPTSKTTPLSIAAKEAKTPQEAMVAVAKWVESLVNQAQDAYYDCDLYESPQDPEILAFPESDKDAHHDTLSYTKNKMDERGEYWFNEAGIRGVIETIKKVAHAMDTKQQEE